MNEKIKQLAEKAGFYLWEDEPWKPEGAVVDWSCEYDSELEKFAELILSECIKICQEGSSTQTTGTGAAQKIKQNFGIE
jgi:hypothetical protein